MTQNENRITIYIEVKSKKLTTDSMHSVYNNDFGKQGS